MASSAAVYSTEQPREICRFVELYSSANLEMQFVGTFFPMYAVSVIAACIPTIDRVGKRITSVDIIYKENAAMERDAGMQ